jgi:hypothetical protein
MCHATVLFTLYLPFNPAPLLLPPPSSGAAADGNGNTVNALGASAANIAPRFSFQLEKRHLSTIHLNSIARIYGDHGELSLS